MKKGLVIALFLVLLVSCAVSRENSGSTVDIDNAAKPENLVTESPSRIQADLPQNKDSEEKRIIIERKAMNPEVLNIHTGEKVVWEVSDQEKFHSLSCYQDVDGQHERVFKTDRLYDTYEYSYKFDRPGNYLCIDSVFGSRGNIAVMDNPDNEITGKVIAVNSLKGFSQSLLTLTIFVALVGVITYYVKIKEKKKIMKKISKK